MKIRRDGLIAGGACALLLALLWIATPLEAAGKGEPGRTFPARVEVSSDFAELPILRELDINVDAVFHDWARVYLLEEEARKLRSLGMTVIELPDNAPAMAELAQQQADAPVYTPEGSVPAQYHTYATLTTDLQQIAADHPGITRLISVGQSVQGRELWMMKISDNPDDEEYEPEFAYISSMHGDEVTGKELLYNLIDYLTDNYGSDPRVTNLVDDTEIWIMPSMNPDGTELGQRWNANGFDLNRNFPDQFDDPSNTVNGRQPETARIMEWRWQHSIDLSANMHGGALVANYPMDSNPAGTSTFSPAPAPDHDTYVSISRTYADNNPPMSNSNGHPAFDDGITNGADWYAINGGMQDWQYVYEGGMELTLEVSNAKWPAASNLPGFWDDNLESMLAFMERVHEGVGGLVTDIDTGAPLAATVQLDAGSFATYTDPDVGDYHRVVGPGTYTLTVSAEGYETKVIPNVVVAAGPATVVDVALGPQPVDLQHFASQVIDGGNGLIDLGETADLAVTLRNVGRSATGVSATLEPISWYTQAMRQDASFPDIALNGTGAAQAPYYEIYLDGTAPTGHLVGFALRWRSNEGQGMSEPFFMVFGDPVVEVAPSVDVPVAIPGFPEPVTVESTLNVVPTVEVEDVKVTVDISHTYVADLEVTLESPEGTQVTLHNHTGGSADNIVGTYGVDLSPVDSLDWFDGQESSGTWKLIVRDTKFTDAGTINSWSVEVTGRPFETSTPEMRFRDLSLNDSGNVELQWWVYPRLTNYKVYRSTDPSTSAAFVDVTGQDPDDTDTLFEDTAADPLVFYLVTGEGFYGEGPKGHFGE